jgi:hypothetical protein
MKEIQKYATFAVELFNKQKINSMFSIGRARVFHIGSNPNKVIIDKAVAKELASSIPGTPIVGYFNASKDDFEGHEANQTAYGFVPLEPNFEWVNVKENGFSKEYLEVDVVIWDGRFKEAKAILDEEKSLSMELNPDTMTGTIERIDGNLFYKVKKAEFAGITVLGDDVQPCFKDAQFLSLYSKMVSEYAVFVENIRRTQKGGINYMNVEEFVNKFRLSADEKLKNICEAFCNAKEISTEDAWFVFGLELYDDYALVYNAFEGSYSRAYYETSDTDEIVLKDIVSVTITDVTEEEKTAVDSMKDRYALLEEQISEGEATITALNEQLEVATEKQTELEQEKATKIEELEAMAAEKEEIQEKLEAAEETVADFSKKAKIEVINKFAKKLENKAVPQSLLDNVDELSEEEIKSQLGAAYAEELLSKEEEDEHSNFTLTPEVDDAIVSGPWGLVKKHVLNK